MQVYRWVGASVGSVVLIVLCIAYVDHPFARLALAPEPIRRWLWQAPVKAPLFSLLAGAAIALAVLVRATGRPWAPSMRVAAIAGVASIVAGLLTKFALKSVFGRTGLGTYLRTGEDTFHWFHAGKYFISFPSTHAAQAAAAFAILWIFYPRWRWGYFAAQLGLAILLVAGGFHFLGDIIAGTYVGIVIGVATTWVGEATSNRWQRAGLISEVH